MTQRLAAYATSTFGPVCDHTPGCITCGDTAVEMVVTRVHPGTGLARCRTVDGDEEDVEVDLVGPVGEGDGLLVHAATAIARTGGGTA